MATSPVTYRVSPEVDVELKRLASLHGGVDRALRILFEWGDPEIEVAPAVATTAQLQRAVDQMIAGCAECGRAKGHAISCETGNALAVARQQRPFKPPLLKPSEKKK